MPAYSDFATAYYNAGVDVYNMYITVETVDDIIDWLFANGEDWDSGVYHWNVNRALRSFETIIKSFVDIAHGTHSENAFTDMAYYNNQAISGAGVDMDSLLAAMLQADPSQVRYFIGLVDAYRQSLWNKPFNVEYFAGLARGFEQWP